MAACSFEAMDDMTELAATDEMPASKIEHLASEEVLDALDSLSIDEKVRLRLIERRHLAGTDFAEGELYCEAVCRAVVGTRLCPRGTVFVAFLAQTMRSIASHRRKRLRREDSLTKSDGSGSVREREVLSDDLDPEELLIEQETDAVDTIAAIHACFEDDEEAQMVLLGWADGKKGKDLRELVGVDQPALDYIIKRVRRLRTKRYPK